MNLMNATVHSATHQARIDGWMAEIAKLPPRKQNWKGHLYDKWNVSQRFRCVPDGRTIGEGPGALTTYFEVWKPATVRRDTPGGRCFFMSLLTMPGPTFPCPWQGCAS